jgi:hypothetical protein
MRQQTGDDDVLVKKVCPLLVWREHSGGRKRAEGRWYMLTGLLMRLDGRNTISSYSVSTLVISFTTLTH